jgi:glycosyltransferase involved in cell wall biosynthesis
MVPGARTSTNFLSVLVPCYNEEVIETIRARLSAVFQAEFGDRFEIIFIEDGSVDNKGTSSAKLLTENLMIR